jgi:PAS domain-containing protein
MSTSAPAEAVHQDEIERLRARVAELERERQIPAGIIEKSPLMISIVRAPDFIYELVNPAFQALAPEKEFLGKRFADVWAEVSEQRVGILQNVIDTGRTFEREDAPYSIQREPGAPPEEVYLSYSWIPLPGPDGKPMWRTTSSGKDITGAARERVSSAHAERQPRARLGECARGYYAPRATASLMGWRCGKGDAWNGWKLYPRPTTVSMY